VLRDDSRAAEFGSIGLDASDRLARVGEDAGLGDERRAGLFTGIRLFSRDALDHWPDRDVFEDLRDWLVPAMKERGLRVGGEIVEHGQSVWEPVGTPSEYLRVNLEPPILPSLGGAVESWTGEIRVVGDGEDVLLGRKSVMGEGVHLDHAVVWEGEEVPAGLQQSFGVFAGGRFHPCRAAEAGSAETRSTA
jgi:NDP-sugar pyrophosphorylase family protein